MSWCSRFLRYAVGVGVDAYVAVGVDAHVAVGFDVIYVNCGIQAICFNTTPTKNTGL